MSVRLEYNSKLETSFTKYDLIKISSQGNIDLLICSVHFNYSAKIKLNENCILYRYFVPDTELTLISRLLVNKKKKKLISISVPLNWDKLGIVRNADLK